MTDNQKTIIKKTLWGSLIVIQAYLLTHTIQTAINNAQALSITYTTSISILIQMILLAYTYAILAIATTNESIIIPLVPIPIGVSLSYYASPLEYNGIILGLLLVMLGFELQRTRTLAQLLIKVNPKHTLRWAIYGLFMSYSFIAGGHVFLHTRDIDTMNIPQRIATYTADIVATSGTQNIDSSLKALGIPNTELLGTLPLESLGLDIQNTIQQEVKTKVAQTIEPYKKLATPIIATIVFSIARIYAFIALLIFNITINLIFELATSLKIIRKSTRTVEQEVITM